MRITLTPPAGTLCAIDVGHGHVCVALGTADGRVLRREWRSIDTDANPAAAIDAALTTATIMLADADPGSLLAAAVIVPQPVAPGLGAVVPTPFLNTWNGIDVRARTMERLGLDTVVLENDANAGAIAESDRPSEGLVFVKVSTGIGAGIIAGGRLIRGRQGQAGEIGHVVVRPDGQICGCGNRGCLETLASVPAVLQQLRPVHGVLDRTALTQLVSGGDVASARALRDAGEAIGQAVAPIAAALQADRLVVGGLERIPLEHVVSGVRSKVTELVHESVRRELEVDQGSHGLFSPLSGGLKLAAGAVRQRHMVNAAL